MFQGGSGRAVAARLPTDVAGIFRVLTPRRAVIGTMSVMIRDRPSDLLAHVERSTAATAVGPNLGASTKRGDVLEPGLPAGAEAQSRRARLVRMAVAKGRRHRDRRRELGDGRS